MNLSLLSKLTLSEPDVIAALNLPPPESSKLPRSQSLVLPALNNLFLLWFRVLVEKEQLPVNQHEHLCPHGHRHILEGDDVRGRFLLSVSGYFDFLIRHYHNSPAKELPNAFTHDRLSRFLHGGIDPADKSVTASLTLLSYHYLFVVFSLYFMRLLRQTLVPRAISARFELFGHEGLSGMLNTCFKVTGRMNQVFARRLTLGAVKYAERVYAIEESWNMEHHAGPFSAIRLPELALLANRDQTLLKKYGAKNVERIFENQLALLLQSLGLCVVATRTGFSTVDLVCISSGPDAKVTFLLEAKTTKGRYSLPTKDARALKDYVVDVRNSLTTLPPLTFVLVVSYSAAKTIDQKLARLEADTAVPVRFMRAQQLADLRERLPGPIPMAVFTREILAGNRVVSNELVLRVIRSYQAEQDVHRKFVEGMFAARGVLPSTPEWAMQDSHGDTCEEN